MPISRISIQSGMTGLDLIFDLNTIQKGWVAQIIEGTFGNNDSYSFTDGNLTSVETSNIDINVRLTPVVPITERTPEEILEFLNGASRKSTVTLRDTDAPGLTINYTPNGDTYKAELKELTESVWAQECVIREIKYKYSENPATIEFTISTTKPFLKGSTLDFYFCLRSTPYSDVLVQFSKIFNRLRELNVYGDIEGLALSFAQGYKGYTRSINIIGFPYVFFIKTELATAPCEAWITKNSRGNKSFDFRGGANSVSSYAYITEAYPMFSIVQVKYLLDNYGNSSSKINTSYGPAQAWIRFVQVKKGL